MNYTLEIQKLLSQADSLEYGEEKVNFLKEAVRLADHHQDEQLGYLSRVILCNAAVFSGHGELMLVHFPWVRAKFKKGNYPYTEDSFSWMYSWVIFFMAYSPQIPLNMIEEAKNEMVESFTREGKHKRSILSLLRTISVLTGRLDEAEKFQEAFSLTEYPGDMAWLAGLVNHRAIELHNEGFYYLRLGDNERAIQLFEPVIEGQTVYAEALPFTLSAALVPLIQLNEWEKAKRCFYKGLPKIQGALKYKNLQPEFLNFLSLSRNFEKGIPFFEKHIGYWEEGKIGQERFDYFIAARLFFSLLAREGVKDLPLRIPRTHPVWRPDETYSPLALERYFHREAQALAEKFDLRNGNGQYALLLKRNIELEELPPPPNSDSFTD